MRGQLLSSLNWLGARNRHDSYVLSKNIKLARVKPNPDGERESMSPGASPKKARVGKITYTDRLCGHTSAIGEPVNCFYLFYFLSPSYILFSSRAVVLAPAFMC